MLCQGVKIVGTGAGLPKDVNSNLQIEKKAPTTSKWMNERLGIFERRIAIDQTVSDLGMLAAKDAMQNAKLSEKDIDMIIVATSSPERISPSTACTIHKKLNFTRDIPCFDVNAVCSGFLFALHLAAPMISFGTYKNIMIIGTETYSKITDWSSRDCVFFGDGAGATILGRSGKGWIYSDIKSNGAGTGFTGFNCGIGKTYNTKPKEVWEAGTTFLPDSIISALKSTNLSTSDIDMFFPHQASIHMLKQIATDVGLEHKKIKQVMHKYANIAGASIPIALDDANKKNEFKNGDKLLLSAIGSGWSWGTAVINHE